MLSGNLPVIGYPPNADHAPGYAVRSHQIPDVQIDNIISCECDGGIIPFAGGDSSQYEDRSIVSQAAIQEIRRRVYPAFVKAARGAVQIVRGAASFPALQAAGPGLFRPPPAFRQL